VRWLASGNVLGSDTPHNFPGLAEIHATREARERAMVEAAREAARREAAQEQVATLKADLKVKIEEHKTEMRSMSVEQDRRIKALSLPRIELVVPIVASQLPSWCDSLNPCHIAGLEGTSQEEGLVP